MPVKEELQTNTRSILKNKHLNMQSVGVSTPSIPSVARVGVGTKRKSSAQSGGFSMPPRQLASAPLSICGPSLWGYVPSFSAPRMDNSDEDWGVIEDNDSGCEVEEDNFVAGKKLFVNRLALLSRRSQSQPFSPKKPSLISIPQKGSTMDEVTEAISSGGHIWKWQACSRPVCLELLESIHQMPSPPTSSQPSTPGFITLAACILSFRQSKSNVNNPQFILPLELWLPNAMEMSHWHSYAGPGSETMSPLPWSLRSTTLNMPSPDSSPTSPTSLPHGSHDIMDNEDDMFLEPCEPPETSFVFSITEGTPSPRSKKVQEMLPSKYKPPDSGVVFSDDKDTSNSRDARDDLVTLIARFLAAYPQVARGHTALLHAINVAQHEQGERPS
ncbi:hypothetical protein BDN67DRAFT_1043590 [Paxillus ammoniavirescens]|nr:hypothetical protein BDN67DRAFT_1043590 [Paxillus ammoniavirescens]